MDSEIPKQDGAQCDGAVRSMKCSASEVDAIRRQHTAIAASYEAQRDTTNGSGLPYGPCQCAVCVDGKMPNYRTERLEAK